MNNICIHQNAKQTKKNLKRVNVQVKGSEKKKFNRDNTTYAKLRDQIGNYYYCAEKDNKAMFFASADQFWSCFARDWCDVQWTELPNEQLAIWMDRLAGIEKERDTIFEIIE